MKLALAPTRGVEFQLREIGTALDNNLTFEDNFKLPTAVVATQSGSGTFSWLLNESKLVQLTITTSAGFTIDYSTNGSVALGSIVIVDILNSTGGAMGTVTFSAQFKTAGAFTSPANAKRRTITFYYDGSNLVEIARSGADI